MQRGVGSSPRLAVLAFAALVLAGCGARAKPAAAPTEPPDYDWSQFGVSSAPASAAAKQEAPPDKREPDKKAEKQADKPADKQPDKQVETSPEKQDAKDGAKPAAPDPQKKLSATKIAGQSVSEVSADVVATATQRALQRSLVSANVIVGAEYEQVSVVLDNVAVQIVRPASSPDKAGPKVRSPKARRDSAAKTEAALYDPRADVLVLVRADKKATSTRALSALVSGGAAPAKKNVRAAKPKRARA